MRKKNAHSPFVSVLFKSFGLPLRHIYLVASSSAHVTLSILPLLQKWVRLRPGHGCFALCVISHLMNANFKRVLCRLRSSHYESPKHDRIRCYCDRWVGSVEHSSLYNCIIMRVDGDRCFLETWVQIVFQVCSSAYPAEDNSCKRYGSVGACRFAYHSTGSVLGVAL